MSTRNRAAFAVLAIVLISQATIGGPPKWNAAEVLQQSSLIAVVDRLPDKGYLSTAPIFSRGAPSFYHRFTVTETLLGEVAVGAKIVVAQPPGHMHGFAVILPGESLLFLRPLSEEDVQALRAGTPDWADDLPDQVWTFAWDRAKARGDREGSDGHQWMSWIQFTSQRFDPETRTIIEGEFDDRPRSILLGKRKYGADVEPEREAILTYIKGLIALRQSALAGGEVPDEAELDVFQRDVVQAAIEEREQEAQ